MTLLGIDFSAFLQNTSGLIDALLQLAQALLMALPGLIGYLAGNRIERNKVKKEQELFEQEQKNKARELELKERQWNAELSQKINEAAMTMLEPLRQQNEELRADNAEKDKKIDALQVMLDEEIAKRRALKSELDHALNTINAQAEKLHELEQKLNELEDGFDADLDGGV